MPHRRRRRKKPFLIDLNGAADISAVSGGDLSAYAVAKTEFLDVVAELTARGIDPLFNPSKIEGVAFGADMAVDGETRRTPYIANDNDFLAEVADPTKAPGDPSRGMVPNPNKIYVFAFSDADLPGYVPQPVREKNGEVRCEQHAR